MKKILLPTDFSENAYNAITYVLQLLKDDICEIFLLHTYTPTFVSAGSMIDSYSALTLQKIAEETAQKKMEGLEARLKTAFPNPNHTLVPAVSFNTLISEMKDVVQQHHIDFIVMGTQGATGAKEVFLGTQTMYAIKKMKCPVLAVPSNFSYQAPKEIVFATDYKVDRNNKYLSILREICNTHVSRLHILNAYYGTQLTDKQIDTKAFLDEYFIKNAHLFHHIDGADVIEAIEQFQTKAKINFLVMIHNKHNFLENILFKPVVNEIVYHTNVPFLVIPSIERQ